MFLAAARTLAELSPARHDPHGNLLPALVEIRKISFQVALAVARQAQAEGLAETTPEDMIASAIREKMWEPAYATYERRFR
jgi:malate dehydrogenase (oxaloacetate-decarboxylating)